MILKRLDGEIIAVRDNLKSVVIENKNNLRGVNLRGVNLRGADLRGVNLRGADLRGADLRGADLRGADLRGVNLRWADLRGVNLYGADLRWADLYGADLCEADLRGVNLRGVNLCGADLCGADLRGVNLYEAIGNGKEIITMQSDRWTVTRTTDVMQIGCKRYTINQWMGFSDEEIAAMDQHALEWWTRWKPILQKMIEAAPAVIAEKSE